jgi:hypothetical protein
MSTKKKHLGESSIIVGGLSKYENKENLNCE